MPRAWERVSGRASRRGSRLLLTVLALSVLSTTALAQSRQTCPPTQGGSRPGGGDSGGSVSVDVGSVIDALRLAAKKKREADARKKAEAEKAAAAERERIAQAERDRAAAERQADAATMRPIPDPPESEPEPARPVSTRPAADATHVKPTENAGPRRRPPPPAPEVRPAPEPARPVAAPTPVPPPAPAPVVEPVPEPAPPAPPPPVAAAPPPALPPAPPPQTDLVDVTSGPLSRRLALALAVLLGVLVTALFAARRFLGWSMAPVEVRPGMDPGEATEADFAGLAAPAFAVHVGRGETTSEIHYPQAVEGQS